MFRNFVIAAAVATLTVLSPSALLGQEAPPAPGATHQPMMMPKPVNLKVLPKDISSEQLMKIMFGFNQALGVKCTFCHAQEAGANHPNFASDAKPEKSTARTMISMTNEINAKYMSQIHDPDAMEEQKTLACSTCHKGHNMPIPFKAPAHGGLEHPGMEHPATPPKE
jgi:Photosynthetic reaction centre cytochrome C subunit